MNRPPESPSLSCLTTTLSHLVTPSRLTGVGRIWIGKDGLLSTPATSAVIRAREGERRDCRDQRPSHDHCPVSIGCSVTMVSCPAAGP